MNHELRGVGAALVTPFLEDFSIDYSTLDKQVEYIINNDVDYLVVNGTTGESPTTILSEKVELLKRVKAVNNGRVPIVYGAGGNSTSHVIYHINQMDLTGVSALLSVCPYYNKPTQAGLIAHFNAIADASPIPVILYNVPGRTITNINVETTVELAKHPNIIGLKDATSSIEQAMALAKALPEDFLLLSGDDNLVVSQISVGYQGVISVIANGFPKDFSAMTHAALNGDFKTAAGLQYRFLDFDTLLYAEGNPVGIKKVMEIRGLGSARTRLPLLECTPALGEKIKDAMVREGFLKV